MSMTKAQIEHCGEIAVYTKFIAVRLMTATKEDKPELAALFLELSTCITQPNLEATPENAQDLLAYVEANFNPRWVKWKRVNRDRTSEFQADRAVMDLRQAHSWFDCILQARLETGGRAEAEQYLRLREQVSLSRPAPLEAHHVDDFLKAFDDYVLDLAKKVESQRKVVSLDAARKVTVSC